MINLGVLESFHQVKTLHKDKVEFGMNYSAMINTCQVRTLIGPRRSCNNASYVLFFYVL